MFIRKAALFFIIIFFIISCEKKLQESSGATVNSNNSPEIRGLAANYNVAPDARKAVINADCYCYSFSPDDPPLGKFLKGQEVIMGENYYLYLSDVMVEVKTVANAVIGYVFQQYVTLLGAANHDFWFKNIMLTREYYYAGTAEEIIYNEFGNFEEAADNIEKVMHMQWWRAFYSQCIWVIHDNFMVLGNDRSLCAYRIESIAKDENMYALRLSESRGGECEIIIVDYGDGIAIGQYNVKKKGIWLELIEKSMNFKYVVYDNEKTEEVKNNVRARITEQIEILGGEDIIEKRYP